MNEDDIYGARFFSLSVFPLGFVLLLGIIMIGLKIPSIINRVLSAVF